MQRVGRRAVLAALLAAPACAAASPAGAWQETVTGALSRTAGRRGRRFGAAVRFGELQAEPGLQATVLRDCDLLTPEVHMMWKALEPAPGVADTGEADGLVAFARRGGLVMHGHALLWGLGAPAWAQARMAHERDWALVRGHVRRTLARFGDDVPTWTVVNEAVGAGRLNDTPFLRAFGPGYIEQALRDAHEAAPRARLMLNDFGLDYENETEQARRRTFLALLRELRAKKAPLHGVGLQAHLDLAKGPVRAEPLRAFLRELADLDLEIAVTELDVQERDYALPLEVRDRRVAAEAARYLQVALDEPAVTSVTTWGLTDRHSWLEGPDHRSRWGEAEASAPERRNRGLPYDAELRPKPMYWAVHDSLAAAAPSRAA